jgi:hypothetical protein
MLLPSYFWMLAELVACFMLMLGLLLKLEDGCNMFLLNVG